LSERTFLDPCHDETSSPFYGVPIFMRSI